jgi:single-strand DNA-binding protein
MNQCHFYGNLTRDPELKNVGSDKKVVNFGLAVNRRFKRGKETAKEVAFLDMEAWDSGAELISKYLFKGDPVIVHCSVKQDSWTDPEGKNRTKLKFRVNSFEFVGGGKKERPDTGRGGDEEPAGGSDGDTLDPDDGSGIPF